MRGAIVLVRRPHVIFAASALVLAGCSSSGGLTTASLMGGGNASEASASAAAPAGPPPSDPTSRTLQVAATSARATRCGFYFDPERLKSSFLAARWLKAPVRRSFRKSSANTITYARPSPRKSPRIADTATTPEPKKSSATSTAILLATSRRHPKAGGAAGPASRAARS